jgi:energy-coupling factor transporter ATP-binding protein EcfA2
MLLQVSNIAYRYPQNQQGLAPVSLDVASGDAWLVTGPSGCGKSTLARCLTGLIPHLYRGEMAGEVWLDGLNTATTPLWQLTERAGLVFQNPAAQMLASTVEDEIVFGLENLGLPHAEIGDRLEQVVTQFDLSSLRNRSPLTLSGGEQQKVALAATMARRPALLVLDEPLSMLDHVASHDLISALATCAGDGAALVICEHRCEQLQFLPGLQTFTLGENVGARPFGVNARHSAAPFAPTPHFTLEVEHLGVTLDGREVLRDLSFSVPGGQIVAIVGRNGVGKTTRLRALVGLQRYSGAVGVAGKRPDFAMTFQNPDIQLFNATVREEILYKLPAPDMTYYHWLLEILGLADYEATPPLLLSEGEKKRVTLATALMCAPRHGLLLDEPSLGQDAGHKTRLMALARALADTGRVVIMTTHDHSLAAQSDRVLLMDNRGFVADGPPEDILTPSTVYRLLSTRFS